MTKGKSRRSKVAVQSKPFGYLGGKSRLKNWIISHLPSHQTFVEVFAGSASVLLAKKPSPVEIYNDIDNDLVNVFQVLRDEKSSKRLQALLEHTLYARGEFKIALKPTKDPVERARRFIVRQQQSYAGRGQRWGFIRANSNAGTAGGVNRWLSGIAVIPRVHKRLVRVQIECADWRTIIRRYDSKDTAFYIDPPYHPEERVAGGYRHELTDKDHQDLVRVLLQVQGKVLLSGYRNDIYQPLEDAGWKRLERETTAFSSDLCAIRVECLWISPNARRIKRRGAARLGSLKKKKATTQERMQHGAYYTHRTRRTETEQRIKIEIRRLKRLGLRVSKAAVARSLGVSREHLSRHYSPLFKS